MSTRSPLVDELVACWRVVMTTHDGELFTAAVSRGRALLPLIDPAELTADEAKRFLLDSAVMALAEELGIDSYDQAVEFIAHNFIGSGAIHFYVPEFYTHMRKSC